MGRRGLLAGLAAATFALFPAATSRKREPGRAAVEGYIYGGPAGDGPKQR